MTKDEREQASMSTDGSPELPTEALEEAIRNSADSVLTRNTGAEPARVRAVSGIRRGSGGRVAIIDGCRTPFCKAGTELEAMNVVDLAGVVAAEIVTRNALDPQSIDLSVFGVVVPALEAPNLGREVVFRASLPMEIPGSTVNLACASSNRAMTSGAEAILTGQCRIVLTGGAESLSNVPIQVSKRAARHLRELDRARTMTGKLKAITRFRPRDFVPVAPSISEYTTGMTMGQAAEKMAKENLVSRRAQDEVALLSHKRAAAARVDGRFGNQIVAVYPPPHYADAVTVDNGVRRDTSMPALERLTPVFDRKYGSITAGNSSPITDGAASVLLMGEDTARALGYRPLGFIRSYAYAGVDPGGQLLQGPAYAAPAALDAAGLSLADIDLVEMHEAFAAQIVSNLKALASARFAREELGRERPVGEVDVARLNVNGGSIAIGHPFGATGARVTVQLLRELERRDQELGLLTVCAAGGVGFAMVVERQ